MYFERCPHCQTDIELGSKYCPHCFSEIPIDNKNRQFDFKPLESNKTSKLKNVLIDVFGVLGATIITYVSIIAFIFMFIKIVIYVFQGMLENIFRDYKG